MRGFRFSLLLLVGASTAWSVAAQEIPPRQVLRAIQLQVQTAIGSMKLETRGADTNLGSVEVTSLTIPAPDYRFRLALPQNPEAGGSSLSRFLYDERAEGRKPFAVFTGGFLETYTPATPAGLVQQMPGDKPQVLNRLRTNDSVMKAVVCYSSKGPAPVAIFAVSFVETNEVSGDCIQTGPFLVRDGVAVPDSELETADRDLRFPFSQGQFHRAFLVLDSRGNIVVGVTSRTSLFALRDILQMSVDEKGFGARTAVALSGTRSAGLLVVPESGGENAVGNVRTLLPNAVVVLERR